MLFLVPEMEELANEWKLAEKIVSQEITAAHSRGEKLKYLKIRRKDYPHFVHSYLFIHGELYRMDKSRYLGIGAFGKIKLIYTSTGKVRVIKITAADENNPLHSDAEFAKNVRRVKEKLGEETHSFIRTFTEEKILIKHPFNPLFEIKAKSKRIQLDYLAGEKSLYSVLQKETLLYTQKTLIAILACVEVETLHAVREIHRDIKSSNYRIAIDANNPLNIILHLVDRDFATELPSRKSKLISENAPYRITPGFNAPETVSKKELSCKADIYSLGVLLGDELKLTSSQTIISNPAKAVIAAMKNASAEKRPEIHEVVSNLWNELPSSLRNAGYLRDTKIAVERLQLLAAARKTVDHFNKSPPFCRYFLWRRHQSQQDLFLLQLTNAVKIAENSFSLSNENLVILFTDALNTSPSATFPLSRSMHFLGKNLLGNNFKGSPEQLRQMLYDKVNALKEPIENEQSSYLRKNICV